MWSEQSNHATLMMHLHPWLVYSCLSNAFMGDLSNKLVEYQNTLEHWCQKKKKHFVPENNRRRLPLHAHTSSLAQSSSVNFYGSWNHYMLN